MSGGLADQVVWFARALRRAGIPVGPAAVVDALQAVEFAGVDRRDDFYWALHAILVTRRDQHAVFDEVFRLFWRPPVRPGCRSCETATPARKSTRRGASGAPPRRCSKRWPTARCRGGRRSRSMRACPYRKARR